MHNNGLISRIILYVTQKHPHISRRVIYNSILSLILGLLKWRREKHISWDKLSRNSISLLVLGLGYQFLRNEMGLKDVLSWCATLSTSIYLSPNGSIPNWLTSYITLESICDIKLVQRLLSSRLNNPRIKQALLCFTLLFLRRKTFGSKRIRQLLYKNNSIWHEFIVIYAIFTVGSCIKTLKALFAKRKLNDKQQVKERSPPESRIHSSNLKPLLDKLDEIYEVTINSQKSILEKVINSFLVENIVPSVKWTLWKKLLVASHDIEIGQPHRSNFIIRWVTLMMAFYTLDSKGETMPIKGGIIKYLTRIIISGYMDLYLHERHRSKKVILLASSVLEFYNQRMN